MNRPNDQRGFIHKKILGLGSDIAGFIGSQVPGPTGGFLTIGSEFLGGLAGRSSRRGAPSNLPVGIVPIDREFREFGARASGRPAPRLPESPEMRKNRRVGIAPQDRFQNGCPPDPAVCAPRGFHVNKSSYFLSDGTFIAKGSRFVRNRRLNNANGRAQDKAIVRLEKGQDHAKKLLKATGWRTISKQSSREMRNARKKVCA